MKILFGRMQRIQASHDQRIRVFSSTGHRSTKIEFVKAFKFSFFFFGKMNLKISIFNFLEN